MFTGKHTKESNKKRSETIKRLYSEGKIMGFKSDKGKEAIKRSPHNYWKAKKLPYSVWNKGKRGVQISWSKGKKFPERSGENNPRWKGGITPLRQKIKSLDEWKLWIKTILERDNYKCRECGLNSNKLHVHHIVTYSIIRSKNNILSVEDAKKCEELWDINNGITLCKDCHKKTDTYLNNAFGILHEEERTKKEKNISKKTTR